MRVNLTASMLSIFVLSWLIVLRVVPSDVLTWAIFLIFMMIALANGSATKK